MNIQPTITVTETGNLHIHIPMLIRRMRGRKVIIAPKALDGDVPDSPEMVQTAIVQALARASSWADILESGEVKSISDLAMNLDVDNSYVARILKLSTLAPDIVEAILNGEEPTGLSLAKLTKTFPTDWDEQRAMFGFTSA
ncbi:hypothetical protein DSCA_02950 [Desulfosarcina alkanivorans]|uniref:Phage-related protein n=1 Tax=Desulfosarcina alkanivorans TaxID=571177 RepID=A0A5K7YD55_9BACT|nr:hypothetical protein [Desulfosarcina alkanivorans]BBO66365.1 hypothetical protein DSCA_02950 [Desulfosarcina alkanivorans]